ncbi:MAG: fatty acid desaturase [Planctomycetales bacterium]|jgi:fatty acid desaturase|nr:fatty acid desaturase [Planctomycetales bacterium]
MSTTEKDRTRKGLNSYGKEWLWPRFLMFPTVAILGHVGFVCGWGGESLAAKLAYAVFLGYCWYCISGSFHESVHQTMCRSPRINIWFGRIVGTLIGIPYTAYRETHIRHHAYLNTAEDYELWPYSKPGASLMFRRAFVLFDIVGAVFANPVVYGRIYFVRKSPLSVQSRRAIGREYIAIAVFWGVCVWTVAALSLSGTIQLQHADLLLLLPLPIAAGFNGFRKFTEHLGMASTDPILGTRTVIGNNWLTRISSYFNFNLDVHGPHHRFPRTPHFELESKLEEYQLKHPGTAIPVFSSYLAATWDAVHCLWWNPGVGENARSRNLHSIPIDPNHVVVGLGKGTADTERESAA